MNNNSNTGVWQKAAMPVFLMIVFVFAIWGVSNLTKSLKNPPKLTITSPIDMTTAEDKVTITGQTEPKAKLTINKNKVALDKEGKFSYTLPVKEGTQSVDITATRNYSVRDQKVMVTRTSQSAPIALTPKAPSTNVAPKTTTGAVAGAEDSDLSASGPAETVSGAFGLTAIIFAITYSMIQKKKLRVSLYKPFTLG